MYLWKVISGGQTGADQGGLAGAEDLGFKTGGWAPRGWRTEKGSMESLLKRYGLVEAASSDYPTRTKKNAKEADGTLWVGNVGSPGYACTKKACTKPWIENPTRQSLLEWVEAHKIGILNVAGNRESTNPGIYQKTRILIVDTFTPRGI